MGVLKLEEYDFIEKRIHEFACEQADFYTSFMQSVQFLLKYPFHEPEKVQEALDKYIEQLDRILNQMKNNLLERVTPK